MTLRQFSRPLSPLATKQKPHRLWFERLMAIVALLNLLLVAFDYSYIPWRNLYLKKAPQFTGWYGERFKGIEPHRFTEGYLQKVNQLEQQVTTSGLTAPATTALLTDLQTLSGEMIDENPFEIANKSGTLERIKRLMRERTRVTSAKVAFSTFWSQAYLTQAGWTNSISFFNQRIRPLIATNYYRGIGENGEPIDRFWQLDLWFIGLFGAEFIVRTLYLSRRYRGVSWLDAIIWRWYDLLLLIPFWRWLRVIPVVIRLDQSRLVNLQPLNDRIVRSLISGLAVEITEIVVLRIINQLQEGIRRGDLIRWLLAAETRQRYIDLNGVNEVEVIAKRLTDIMVYHVLPAIKPEVEAVLHHSVAKVLGSSPAYAGLQRIPGVSQWSEQLTRQLIAEVSQNTYGAIVSTMEDDVGNQLMQRLVSQLGEAFRSELQKEQAIDELRSLVVALLDEVKINYVQRIAEEDIERLRAQTANLYEITRSQR